MRMVGGLIDALKKTDEKTELIAYRHHNPYVQESLQFFEFILTQSEIKKNPAALYSKFTNSNVVIEIGCYYGKTVIELAQLNPHSSILGVDITYKRVIKTARRIKQSQLSNVCVALCEGAFLFQDILQNNSIQGVCVFFPDPWPKTRQKKNRLLNESFIHTLFQKIKPGGFVWLKTDHHPYFLEAEFLFLQRGFILDTTPPYHLQKGSYETEFQKLFSSQNTPFYEGVYIKPK